ncbi:hypothetical protein D3C80_1319780 [compost metagenome]
MGHLAAGHRDQQQADETDDQLIEQRQGHRCFRQPRGAYHHGGCTPGRSGQYTERVAQQHAPVQIVPGHATGKRNTNADKRQQNSQPLHRPQALTRQQPMHAQCGEDRRGVEEHRHMRRRGQLQAFGDEQELEAKQATGQQTAAPGAADLVPTALPADQQAHQ